MPSIKWKGIISDTEMFQKGELSQSAVKMDMPLSIREMQVRSLPLVVPFIVILAASMFLKSFAHGAGVIEPYFVLIGFVFGFLLLPLHELLHAVVYPKDAEVSIGFMPKQFAAVALVSYPVSRSRFIFMSMLPIILGIIPLAAFILAAPQMKCFNGFMFGAAAVGMTSVCPDIYNVIHAVRQPQGKCKIQFYEDDMYWIPKSE